MFVGTAGIVGYAFDPLSTAVRVAFGALALAILIPQHGFPGRRPTRLDWSR